MNNKIHVNNNGLPILFTSVGIPGSSKSTWLENHKEEYNYTIHSSDAIRAEFGDINDQSKNSQVFETLHNRIKTDLLKGKNVAYDATNLSRRKRTHFLTNELKNITCYKVCLLFATPWEVCCMNNFNRYRHVPIEVMVKMYKNFNTPWYTDGFDEIHIIWYNYDHLPGFEYNLEADLYKWKEISHDSPWHSLSIGDHMIKAAEYSIEKYGNNDTLLYSCLLHDCGKPYVKSWQNSKGEPTDIAHFYNHENCSAYMCLFYLKKLYPNWNDKKILYISLLINLHMRHHTAWKSSDKAKEKDRRLFGDDTIKLLDQIYTCDLAAH